MPTLSTVKAARAWAPDQNMFAPEDTLEDALILDHSTVSANIDGDQPSLRVGYMDDDTAQFTAEGDEIPESEPQLNEVLVHTGKITQLVQLSTEQYYQAGTSAQVAQSVGRAITLKADEAFLTNQPSAGAGGKLTGLAENTELSVMATPVTGDLDPLIDLVATLEANKSAPTAIILDPIAWGTIRKLKTQDGANTNLLGAGTKDAERSLLNLPVIVTPAMKTNTGLVIDHRTIISAVGPVNVKADESYLFNKDSVAVRATWRIGWNIVRPERNGLFTIGA